MYQIHVLDPFLSRQLKNENSPSYISSDELVFTFSDEKNFINAAVSYFMSFGLTYTFDKLVLENVADPKDKNDILAHIHQQKIGQLMDPLYHHIKCSINTTTTPHRFDFISLFLSGAEEERKLFKNILYEAAHLTYSNNHSTSVDSLPDSSEEIVYFVVHSNGSIQLNDKFSEEIEHFSYHQQEEAVAKTCYLNPDSLIIYDQDHLLDPEMVICFKKILGRKVNFIDAPFPQH